jgi:hypothetical protein
MIKEDYMNIYRTKTILTGISAIILTVVACSLGNVTISYNGAATPTGTASTTATPPPTSEGTASATPTEAQATVSLAATNTSLPADTPTPNGVVITAIHHGSIGILRGTSLYYDILGYLKNGQSSTATARNSDGTWLYIPVPDYPSVYGWAYDGSVYSIVTGNVKSLPIRTIDPAVPAYIRNCTFDLMMIQPGNVLLQPQTDTVNNKKQFMPGAYTAFDQGSLATPTPPGTPQPQSIQVQSITLKEGVSVDIDTDALAHTYSCP